MPDLTPQDMAARLAVDNFQRAGPAVQSLSDPIADTPMIVTLDELRPYDLNPRVTRNPRYDDIRASIRERGIDAPPPITRRPGESHFIVRNGGNTRLAILKELWAETKDDKFFRIACLFRPWSARGEIVALTGHLAENELHGGLSFIERALGVEKARELYELETGQSLTQTELARRLTADGYPVTQSQISRMQDAVAHLLPAIPSILYAGLGRPQIERLTSLRKAASRTWDRHAQHKTLPTGFPTLFQEVLSLFDGESGEFSVQRVQDELIGHLAQLLGADYDALALEMLDTEARHQALSREPLPPRANHSSEASATVSPTQPPAPSPQSHASAVSAQQAERAQSTATAEPSPASQSRRPPPMTTLPSKTEQTREEAEPGTDWHDRLQGHIVSPAESTDRLQAIQRTIADATGDSLPDFQANVVQAIPVQAGGLHPISDVWYIEPALDAPDRLRAHLAQLAREIAQEADLSDRIESVDDGIGFACANVPVSKDAQPAFFARAVATLLNALSIGYLATPHRNVEGVRLADDLGPLLQGTLPSRRATQTQARLSDVGLVKLFRLIRLARRLVELESSAYQRASDRTAP